MLGFYGITKDPETKEFILIIQFANLGNLRSILLNNFHNILWENKLCVLTNIIKNLKSLHELKYCHKNLHSNNILQNQFTEKSTDALYTTYFGLSYISDFGLSEPTNNQNNKIYGILPYIAPEILSGEPFSLASDIYSFGIIMAELSSGNLPFYN